MTSENTGEDEAALQGPDVASAPSTWETTAVNADADPPERRVEIVARDFRFTPSRILAAPGETLIIVLRNQGTHEHSIVFDLPGGHQGAREPVRPGQSARFTVKVPSRPGDFNYYCPIDGHRRLGMQGRLTVARPR